MWVHDSILASFSGEMSSVHIEHSLRAAAANLESLLEGVSMLERPILLLIDLVTEALIDWLKILYSLSITSNISCSSNNGSSSSSHLSDSMASTSLLSSSSKGFYFELCTLSGYTFRLRLLARGSGLGSEMAS